MYVHIIALGVLDRKWHLALVMLKHDAIFDNWIIPKISLDLLLDGFGYSYL